MSTLTDIRNVAVNVSDQDAALRFYTDTLGFATHVDGDTPAGRWIMIAPPDANVAISLVANPDATGTDTGIRFGTSNAVQSHRTLTEHGVTVSELIKGKNPTTRMEEPYSERAEAKRKQTKKSGKRKRLRRGRQSVCDLGILRAFEASEEPSRRDA